MRLFPLSTPGGSDTQFQYNNGGLFGGAASATYNDSTGAITFQPAVDSTVFLRILDSSGNALFNADTTIQRADFEGASYPVVLVSRSGRTTDTEWGSMGVKAVKTSDMGDGFGVNFAFFIEDDAGVENAIAAVGAIRDGADNSGKLVLGTFNAGSYTDHACITYDGKFGLGTLTPFGLFEVNADGLGATQAMNLLHNLPTSASDGRAFTVSVVGEGFSRVVFYTNSFIGMGPGSATRDTFIGRSAANTIRIGTAYDGSGEGHLVVGGNLTIGSGTAATDYTLTFNGETNDGVITWMEDEDYFKFANASETIIAAVSTSTTYARLTVTGGAGCDSQVTFQNNSSSKWSVGNDADTDAFTMRTGLGEFGTNDRLIVTSTGGSWSFISATDTDIAFNFTATTNSGLFTWMEDEDEFDFADDIVCQRRITTPNDASTLGVGVTSFAVTSNVMTITGDGAGNTIATITGAQNGTLLTLIFVDGNVTITDTDAHTADTVDLAGTATDFTSADDTVLQLVYDGTSWYEVSRSVN